MLVRKGVIATILVLFASVAAPRDANADWLFTPFIGINWGGTAGFSDAGGLEDEFKRQMNFGASLAWMGAGVAGFEFEVGYSPNFFENTVAEPDAGFGESSVTTFMASLVLGVPIGGQSGPGIRPYVVGGAGLIKTHVGTADDFLNVDSSDWGINLGGGVTAFLSDRVGIRGDLRYFRSLQDNEPDNELDLALSDFRYWRGTVGISFRF